MPPEKPQEKRMSERTVRVLVALAGALLTGLAGQLALSKLGGSLVHLSYDFPFLFNPRETVRDVRIVYLDELDGETLDRRVQAKLLDKLGEAGAKAVVYDLIFDRPWDDPAVDREFAEAILRFRGVDKDWNPIPGKTTRHVVLACGRKEIRQAGAIGEQLIPPTDELLAAADDFGLVALVHDKKFTVRELTTGTRDEPSMTWKAAVLMETPLVEGERIARRWIRYIGRPVYPGEEKKGVVTAVPSISASDVLNEDASGLLRDKIVVVGAKPGIVGAAAGQDLFATPYKRIDVRGDLPLTSGVEIQAMILANLLDGNWITRSAGRFENWMIVIGGVLLGAGFTLLRPMHSVVAAVAVALFLAAAGTWTQLVKGVWFPWSVGAFAQVPVALVWGGTSRFYVERMFRVQLGEQQRQLRNAFAKYVSPQMLDMLTAEGFNIKTGGEKIEAAVIFTDLANFTNMCERVGDPERIVATLNDYFEKTTAHIFDHDGVVIKFIGDAILAVWGAPLKDPDSALKAARAGLKLSHDATLEIEGVMLETRIGIHFGELVAGNIGSARRVDYTLIGDAVNLAARLESLNKTLGTNILISDEVRQRIGNEFHTRLVGRFKVKGRREVTVIHELLCPAGQCEEPEWVSFYHQALEAYAGKDSNEARRLFLAVEESRDQPDGPSRFFINRLNLGEWGRDGVVEMTEK